jgi:hypothetical protein
MLERCVAEMQIHLINLFPAQLPKRFVWMRLGHRLFSKSVGCIVNVDFWYKFFIFVTKTRRLNEPQIVDATSRVNSQMFTAA